MHPWMNIAKNNKRRERRLEKRKRETRGKIESGRKGHVCKRKVDWASHTSTRGGN